MNHQTLPLLEMEIFRTGDYGNKGRYSEAELDQIALDYRPELLEAPLTFDHSQIGPAFGWVAGLRRQGDRLLALLRDVPESVGKLVNTGAYRRRSVEIVRQLPETGRPYLRAVSLLGAASPQVRGLADVRFSDDVGPAETIEAAATVAENPADNVEEILPDTTAAETNAPLSEPDYLAQIQQLRAEIRKRDADAISQQLRARGCHLSPEDLAGIESILEAVDGRTVPFAEENLALSSWFSRFVDQAIARPATPQVPTANAAVECFHYGAWMGETIDREPAPANSDPASTVLHHNAVAIQSQHPNLTYADALVRASRLR